MTTAPALTYHQVKKLAPCDKSWRRVLKALGGSREWHDRKINAAEAVEAGCTLDDIVWVASNVAKENADVERRLRLWMADCAARVLHIFEKERPTDMRPREAIIAARRFARGEVESAARAAAGDAAGAAAWAARAARVARAAWAAAWAARAAAGDARVAAGDAAGAAEEQWQLDRLVLWLSDNEPEDWHLPKPTETTA